MKVWAKTKEALSSGYAKAALAVGLATSWASSKVMAAPVIANDTLEGLPALGTDLGDFMGNLAPGVGKFILILAIFGGIVGIFAALFFIIRAAVRKSRSR